MTKDNYPAQDRGSDDLWADFDRASREVSSGVEISVQLPADRDELLKFVRAMLQDKFGRQPFVDEDGDFLVDHLGQKVWVSVRRDNPVVMVFARVARGVYSRRATEVELGILNRQHLGVKWTLVERDVWLESSAVALPFVSFQLSMLLDNFFEALSSTRDDLAYRTGAKVA